MNKLQPSALQEGYANEIVNRWESQGDDTMNSKLQAQTGQLDTDINTYNYEYTNQMMDLTENSSTYKIITDGLSGSYTYDLTDLKDSNGVSVSFPSQDNALKKGKGITTDNFQANPEKYYVVMDASSFQMDSIPDADIGYDNTVRYTNLSLDKTTIVISGIRKRIKTGTPLTHMKVHIEFTIHERKPDHLKKYHYTGPHIALNNDDKHSLANALLEDTNTYIQQNEQIFALGALTLAILSVGSYVVFRK
jgi:hypothetical protein